MYIIMLHCKYCSQLIFNNPQYSNSNIPNTQYQLKILQLTDYPTLTTYLPDNTNPDEQYVVAKSPPRRRG